MKASMSYNLILLSVTDRDFSDSVSLPLLARDSNPSQWRMLTGSGQAGSGSQRHHPKSWQKLRGEWGGAQCPSRCCQAQGGSQHTHSDCPSCPPGDIPGYSPNRLGGKGNLLYLQLMILANWPEQSDWTVALHTFPVVEKEMQTFFPSLSYGSWPN